MLDALHLTNFKCFREEQVPLRPLTLLTGINGTGKSSVIQALALLRQSASERMLHTEGLLLNGPMVTLGTVQDVLNEFAASDVVGIGLEEGGHRVEWTFDASARDADILTLRQGPEHVGDLSLFRSGVLHLSAERVGPRILHPMSAHVVRSQDEMRTDGTLAVAWFHENQRMVVPLPLRHADADSDALREQAASWLGEISPGVRVSIEARADIQLAELNFSFVEASTVTRPYRPTSVGFGISYTLPIVLACLAGRPGRLLLLENPEAHLHPRGQMAMGDLAARAAAAGAQVIMETHSDHVLNGVRLAVKEGCLSNDKVGIHFFSRELDGNSLVHRRRSPCITSDGRIDEWPPGFFDQMDLALERLL